MDFYVPENLIFPALVLRCNRMPWFGHLKQNKLYTGQILDLELEGNRSGGG